MEILNNSNNSLVSIVVPIYNVEKYLEKCIISLIHQTYKNLEIILVVDGSPDDSIDICKKWASKDDRIKIINKENGGLSDARNSGLKAASGELISFVDSDDWVSINMIEKMVNAIKSNNVDMAICQFVSVYPNGYMEKNYNSEIDSRIVNRDELSELILKDDEITSHVWRRLYKRSLIPEDVFPKGRNFEDIFATPRLIEKINTAVILNEAYYYYLQNDKGVVKTVSYSNLVDRIESTIFAYNFLINSNLELDKVALQFKYGHFLGTITDALDGGLSKSEFRKLLKIIKSNLNEKYNSSWFGKREHVFVKLIKYCSPVIPLSYKLFLSDRSIAKRIIGKSHWILRKKIALGQKYSKPHFIIVGAPRYGNLGDLALLKGEVEFIKRFFPDYQIEEITADNLFSLRKNHRIDNRNVYAIQAGGNIGTLYPDLHSGQEYAIKSVNAKNMLIFPQTFYYDLTTSNGKEVLKASVELYRQKNIQVFTRDKVSFDFVNGYFEDVQATLVPDIALMIDGSEFAKPVFERNGVFICLRNDSERTLTNEKVDYLLSTIEKYFDNILEGDTHLYNDNVSGETFEYVKPLLKIIGSKRMMVTDRLHGMIFAAITSTPCIVVTSKSPKVKGVYEWIKHLPYIKLVENLNDLDEAINSILAIEHPKFDNQKIIEEFERMAETIKVNLGTNND